MIRLSISALLFAACALAAPAGSVAFAAADPDMGLIDLSPSHYRAPRVAPDLPVVNPSSVFVDRTAPGEFLAKDLLGMPVLDKQGHQVAGVSDLIVNDDYQVVAVVLASGGRPGITRKRIALSPYELSMVSDGRQRVAALRIDGRELELAPRLETPLQGRTPGHGGWVGWDGAGALRLPPGGVAGPNS